MEENQNVLVDENYHGTEMRKIYMGSSQFKDFLKCEKEALAKINGEIEEKSSDALLFGSYVDAYFSHEMDTFVPKHPEMFNSKTGELKATFKGAETVIKTIESDELLMKYLSGEHQVIMTGEIAGVKFKIKMDSYHPGKLIVDQKIMRDMDMTWIEKVDESGVKRNVKVDFIEAYRYDIQGAIYQEIVRQNTIDKDHPDGLKLPFVLAVTTKEEYPDKALIQIDQEYLDKALAEVVEKAPRFDAIKKGLIEPTGCGQCGACRKDKKLEGVITYSKLYHDTSEAVEY